MCTLYVYKIFSMIFCCFVQSTLNIAKCKYMVISRERNPFLPPHCLSTWYEQNALISRLISLQKVSCCFAKCVWLSQLHHNYSKCMTITSLDVQRMYEVPKGYKYIVEECGIH